MALIKRPLLIHAPLGWVPRQRLEVFLRDIVY
jgi:hypothetical protein